MCLDKKTNCPSSSKAAIVFLQLFQRIPNIILDFWTEYILVKFIMYLNWNLSRQKDSKFGGLLTRR